MPFGLKNLSKSPLLTRRVSKLPEAKLLSPPFFQFFLFVLLRWSNRHSRHNRKPQACVDTWTNSCGHSSARGQSFKYTLIYLFLFSLLIPLNEIFHVALSYLRMYACGPGTLWGEHPSEQVESIVQHLGHNITQKKSWTQKVLSEPS